MLVAVANLSNDLRISVAFFLCNFQPSDNESTAAKLQGAYLAPYLPNLNNQRSYFDKRKVKRQNNSQILSDNIYEYVSRGYRAYIVPEIIDNKSSIRSQFLFLFIMCHYGYESSLEVVARLTLD